MSHFRDQFDLAFQQREWLIARVCWVLLAAFLIAGLIGVFGGGPLSRATATAGTDGATIEVDYARFARMNSPQHLDIRVEAPHQSATDLTLVLSQPFTDGIEVDGVFPEPESTSFEPAGTAMTWSIEDWSQPIAVRLRYKAVQWQKLDGALEARAGERTLGAVSFRQILFP